MTIQLTVDKKQSIFEMCEHILSQNKVKIRTVAKLLGKFTSSCVGVKYGPLHYRYLDHEKTLALERNNWNFNKFMTISTKGKEDITWWRDNILASFNHIGMGNPSSSVTITTDASGSGWGGTVDGCSTYGFWSGVEKVWHINVLELKAIYFSLKALMADTSDTHLLITVCVIIPQQSTLLARWAYVSRYNVMT